MRIANKKVFEKPALSLFPVLLLCFFFLMSSCGQEGAAPNAGSENTTAVGISIDISNVGQKGSTKTRMATGAPPVIQEVRVVVTNANNTELARDAAKVTPGEPVALTLNVLAGEDRTFTVDAFDAEGKVQFYGRAVTDLEVGPQITLPITVSPPVALDPEEVAVAIGETQTFSTTIHPLLDHNETQWFVNNEPNGNEIVGTITPSDVNTAIYTAPDRLPSTLPIIVKGASDTDPALYFDESAVTLFGRVRHVSVSIGEDTPDCGTETAPCRTLTHAMRLAAPGEMVLAAPGVYAFGSGTGSEIAPLPLKSGVILSSASGPDGPAIIDFVLPGSTTSTAIEGADNATLTGFTIQSSPSFERIIETNGTAPIITNNIFKTTCAGDCLSPIAILANNAGAPLIQNNIFGEDDFRGFSQAIRVSGTAMPRITGNTFVGNVTGIEIMDEAAPVLERNIISDNLTGVSVFDTAAPDLGSEGGSIGQNILSCNIDADLFVNTGTLLFAQNNQWDHEPPTVGTYTDTIPGVDILLEIDSDVDDGGATQTPDGACNIGIRATPDTGLVTTEAGGFDTFMVTLGTQPESDVSIVLTSNRPAEGTASPASLSFDASNWKTPQPVVVTGVNDTIVDGPQNYEIILSATSSDPDYGSEGATVFVTNQDDDVTVRHSLSLPTAGTGSGTISGAGTYDFGSVVTVRADPSPGSTFSGWSGPDAAECEGGSVTMNRDKSCTASFTLDTRTLTLIKTGTGSGRIFSTPRGIDCGSGCTRVSANFPFGRNVTLTAEPAEDSDFTITDWSGCDGAGFTSCNVTMDANKTVTANFRSTAIFRAFFDQDDVAKPPNTTLPGHPEGDQLELRLNPDLDGTILVQEKAGDLGEKPLVLNVSDEGRFGLDGLVAGKPPNTGVYLIRWRSLVTSTLTNANVTIIVRDSIRAFMTGLIYDEEGVSFIDQSVVPWQAGVSQLFEFTLDFDEKVSSLRVDGKDIYEGFEICVPGPDTETSCDLSEISIDMTNNRPSTQGFAIDQIEIFKVP